MLDEREERDKMFLRMRREFQALVTLAVPVILAEIGWMAMGVVDTLMVGSLGPAAIAAVGTGSGVFTAIAIFGMGLMLGLDALVSRAYGAGRLDECQRWLHHGTALALAVAPLVMLATWVAFLTIDWWGLHPAIRVLAAPYLQVVAFGAVPLILYAAFRRYLQGRHVVGPIMFALLSANAVNAAANWTLIYGHLGFPAMGVSGSAWATSLSRLYMAAVLLLAVRTLHRREADAVAAIPFALKWDRIRLLLTLGGPAASQVTLEVGVFVLATALAARLDPVSSASHQIALNIASVIFMIPLGLSSAAAVRVGHAVGSLDARRAVDTGWTALAAGTAIMTALGLVLFLWPIPLLKAFTTDVRVLELGVVLLMIAAAFQLFDGTQAVATGVLRGLGDTRTPMTMNVVGHWLLGLPIGYMLCFRLGWGVAGLWVGLSVGLIFVAVVLTFTWARRTRQLTLPGHRHQPAFPDLL